jgi:hypothetical protein
MSIVTCGLSDEGIYAHTIPFSTNTLIVDFDEDVIAEPFVLKELTKEFTAKIPVVEFDIDIIRIEECSWQPD